jgi:hypothetical protein
MRSAGRSLTTARVATEETMSRRFAPSTRSA